MAGLKLSRAQKRSLRRQKKRKFKSSLEKFFAAKMMSAGLGAEYEPDRLEFVKKSHYIPDFKIKDKVYIETKGWFSSSDRGKMVAFLEQYPDVTVYMVFGNASNRLTKASKTTYGQWATKHGIKWIDIKDPIPQEWWN